MKTFKKLFILAMLSLGVVQSETNPSEKAEIQSLDQKDLADAKALLNNLTPDETVALEALLENEAAGKTENLGWWAILKRKVGNATSYVYDNKNKLLGAAVIVGVSALAYTQAGGIATFILNNKSMALSAGVAFLNEKLKSDTEKPIGDKKTDETPQDDTEKTKPQGWWQWLTGSK